MARAAVGGDEVADRGVAIEAEVDREGDRCGDEGEDEEHQARAQQHRRCGEIGRAHV